MDYSYTPDQELFIESAKEFAEKYFDDKAVKKAYEEDHHISLESALLKSYACQNLTDVADHALSIYAAIGYTKEIRAGRIWNDLRGYEMAGGTTEVMDYIAGRQLVKKYAK